MLRDQQTDLEAEATIEEQVRNRRGRFQPGRKVRFDPVDPERERE